MGVEDFETVSPGEILPESPAEIRNELDRLRRDLLLSDVAEKYFLTHSDGQLYVKKYLNPLVSKVSDQRQNENFIDKTQGKMEIKSYFKGLWSRLKEKSQEEIVAGLISGAKQYGPAAILFLIKIGHTT
jgi:hypothetical protein